VEEIKRIIKADHHKYRYSVMVAKICQMAEDKISQVIDLQKQN
jgi:hypothetical protein